MGRLIKEKINAQIFEILAAKPQKRNVIFDELHKAERTSADFDVEVTYIIHEFQKPDYAVRFINNTVNEFIKSTDDVLFHPIYSINKNLPFCDRNENKSKEFLINSKYQQNELGNK